MRNLKKVVRNDHQVGIGYRAWGQVANDGSCSQGIEMDHKAGNYDHKPLKSGGPGKAGRKG